MTHHKTLLSWGSLVAAGAAFLVTGCRTANVNPPSARAHTGYVDFYTAPSAHAYWYLARQDERSGKFKEVYSEFSPPRGGILRVAMKPGTHTFRVAFLNKVFESAWDGNVEVKQGMITPVSIQLVPAGEALVQRYKPVTRGRVANSNLDVQTSYRIEAEIRPPVAYQPKEAMDYPAD